MYKLNHAADLVYVQIVWYPDPSFLLYWDIIMFGTDVFYVCIVRRFFVYLGDKMIWNFMISYWCIYEDAITDRDCDMMNKLEILHGNTCISKLHIKMNSIYVCSSIESALQEGFDT